MLRLAREREHLRIVADQHGGPTWSFELARMTADVIGQVEGAVAQEKCSLERGGAAGERDIPRDGAGETTWCGFAAQAIAELQKLEPEAKLATVEAIHDGGVSDAGKAADEFAAGLREAGTDVWVADAGVERFAVALVIAELARATAAEVASASAGAAFVYTAVVREPNPMTDPRKSMPTLRRLRPSRSRS
jgi:hypothetical protein